jgi:hypothetical protein
MKAASRRARILLDLARLDVPGLVSFGRVIAKGLTNNSNFTAADIAKLPVAAVDMGTLATTVETTHTSRPTAPSKAATKLERDQASALADAIRNDGAYVEGFANTKAAGDLAQAEAIILSVGYQLSKTPVRAPPKGFDAESPAQATARVTFPPREKGEVVLLQYSGDGGKTWSLPIVVHGRELLITGLTRKVEYLFQMATSQPPPKRTKQTLTAGTEAQVWSDSASCVIT